MPLMVSEIGSVFLLECRHRPGHRFWIAHNERPRSNAQNMVRRCARRSCHEIDVRPIGKNSLPAIDVQDASSMAREQTAQAEEERLIGGGIKIRRDRMSWALSRDQVRLST